MTPPPSTPSPEALLAQADWVRALVRKLVLDESSADEVVQETWLAAMTHPMRDAGSEPSLRAWLAKVARHLALRSRRGDMRRDAREELAARPERLPSTAEVVEREDARRRIVEAVLALDEPYRSTLILRFYEELAPRDIARLQGVNGSTVRNRLKRGIECLRERFEREHGSEWRDRCLLVLPFAAPLNVMPHSLPNSVRAHPSPSNARATPSSAPRTDIAPMHRSIPRGRTAHVSPGNGSGGSIELAPKIPALKAASWAAGGLIVATQVKILAAVVIAGGVTLFCWKALDEPTPTTGDAIVSSADVRVAAARDARVPKTSEPLAPSTESPDARTSVPVVAAVAPHLSPKHDVEDKSEVKIRLEGTLRDAAGRIVCGSDLEIAGTVTITKGDLVVGNPIGAHPKPISESPLRITVSGEEQPASEGNLARLPVAASKEMLAPKTVESHLRLSSTTTPTISLIDATGTGPRTEVGADGRFALTDLHPGHWKLVAEAGHHRMTIDIDLDPKQPVRHIDVVLSPVGRLKIYFLTPLGGDLAAEIARDRELRGRLELVPIATHATPPKYVADLRADREAHYGLGWFHPRSAASGEAHERLGFAGTLDLVEHPPLIVSATLRSLVLASQPVEKDEGEVTFVISMDQVRACLGDVHMSIVDSALGGPLVGAKVRFAGSSRGGVEDAFGARADGGVGTATVRADGVVTFTNVVSGWHTLSIEAKDHESLLEDVLVEPGARDLGTFALDRTCTIRGRTVDSLGKSVQVALQIYPLARFENARAPRSSRGFESRASGAFEITGIGRKSYLLRVQSSEWTAMPIVVDTSDGPVNDVLVTVMKGVEVTLQFNTAPPAGALARIATPRGLPVLERELFGMGSVSFRLTPGDYTLRVMDGEREIGSRDLGVAGGGVYGMDLH